MSDSLSEKAIHARRFLKAGSEAILSTISLEVPGYPFGSVAPYAIDHKCRPIILISGLAQHTKNIDVDSRVSLTIIADPSAHRDIQENARLTYVGNAQRVEGLEKERAESCYLRKFPHAAKYFSAHDFYFYVVELERARYIEGFGKIWWVEKDELPLHSFFSVEEEMQIIDHMNSDHKSSLVKYCELFNIPSLNEDDYSITSVDSEGFNVNAGHHKYRIDFIERLTEPSQARSAFISLSK
jgi:heme iron utilization protein